jgi:D-alanyl-D-alanine carboxypeptidase (penicillin-binding protein 5/6)
MRLDTFRSVVATQKYTCLPSYSTSLPTEADPANPLEWENTNKLLEEGFDGVKTGITPNAGPCLASSYRGVTGGNSFHLCFVLISAASMQHRWH